MDSSRRRSQPCSSVFFFMRHSALLYERRPRFLPFFFFSPSFGSSQTKGLHKAAPPEGTIPL